jgi:aspartyl-tRNA(Asn)/glutamyl-tRNA(Gln) amidotransferase subunit A
VSELYNLTIEEAAAKLTAGEITSLELTEACLKRIEAVDKELNSFVTVLPELARIQAKESDTRRAAGKAKGLLDGIPYNLKDVYATNDSPTSASSHMLEGWVAPYNAAVYAKLKAAGAVIIGKTNTDEFTMGSSTETSYMGVTRNPWDRERTAGGSSGGPAASMAAGLGLFSIGTDTAGSIRQPASFCGVVGFKPTYGRISRWGEIPMANSFDQSGPITRTMRDAAIVLQVLSGHDPYDANTSELPVPDYLKATEQPLKGLKIGIPAEYFGEGVLPEVETAVRDAVTELEKLGATTKEVSLPVSLSSLAAYYIICPAEVSSNMARYDGIRYGYSVENEEPHGQHTLYEIYSKSRGQGIGAEVRRRIMLGTNVLSAGHYDAYYKKGQAVRIAVADEFEAIFKEVDILATPVSPHSAFKIGAVSDPLTMYKEDVLTVPANIGGIPGVSLPCGFVGGLPVGLQLMAARFNEEVLLQAGAAYQTVTDHHLQKPNLSL